MGWTARPALVLKGSNVTPEHSNVLDRCLDQLSRDYQQIKAVERAVSRAGMPNEGGMDRPLLLPVRLRGGFDAYAMVDADMEHLGGFTWIGDRQDYPFRWESVDGGRRAVYLHREVMGLVRGDGKIVDHVHHNVLDCRRGNLRLSTVVGNAQNRRGPQLGNPHGYRGVTACKRGKFRAIVTHNGVQISKRGFATPQEAADFAADTRRRLGFVDDSLKPGVLGEHPVVLGNRWYETDVCGRPINLEEAKVANLRIGFDAIDRALSTVCRPVPKPDPVAQLVAAVEAVISSYIKCEAGPEAGEDTDRDAERWCDFIGVSGLQGALYSLRQKGGA
jgi:hypothetical protein